MLSSRGEAFVRKLLGDDAECFLELMAESPGIPESPTFPAVLDSRALDLLVHLGIPDPDTWRLLIDAEAESFGRRVEKEARRHREAQARYRESLGDEYREKQREYTRKWRDRKR